jgi:RNAse (barnase) inhibitor barstar
MIKNLNTPYLILDNTHIAIIQGKECKNIDDFYTHFILQLNVPDYFGHNLDALEEVVNDLSWIEQKKCCIIISDSKEFLKDDKYREDVNDILNNIESKYVEVLYLNTTATNV